MASNNFKWKIVNAVLLLPIFVWGKPLCGTRFRAAVVCVAGQADYILKRGLISDNNLTVAIILKDCRITDVDTEAFKNIHNLEEIDLSRNKISCLKLGVLDRLPKLKSLRLSKNLLTNIPLGLYDNLPKLERLDISDNKIHSLDPGIFNNLSKLLRLDLSRNVLLGKELDPTLFARNQKIKYLFLSGNNMSEAPDQLLNAFRGLTVLEMNNCSLTEIPKFATSPNLKTLEQLRLQLNQIRSLDDPTLFVNLENLLSIDLIGNEINNLNEGVFKPLTKISVIDLSFNNIERIPEKLFQNMISIQSIDLANNLIEIVPVNAFRRTRLKKLNFNSNKISFFDNNFLLELRNSGTWLLEFYFIDNPFQCACLLDILNEVKYFGITYNSVKYNGEHAVCNMTDAFKCMRYKKEFEYPMDVRQIRNLSSTKERPQEQNNMSTNNEDVWSTFGTGYKLGL